jgi:DNA gyrase subunit A
MGIASVMESDELLMMTARGKIQRIRAADINVIGRNTQGVRIMSLDEGDKLVAIVRVPTDETTTEPNTPETETPETNPPDTTPPETNPPEST